MADMPMPGAVTPFQEITRSFPGASSTSSGKVRSKAIIGLENQLGQAEEERLKLNADDVENARLRDEAALKKSQDEMARMEATKQQQLQAEQDKAERIAQWKINEEKQQAEVDKAAGAKGYMENKPGWFKALAAVMVGLGAKAGTDAPMRLFREAQEDERKKNLLRLEIEQKKLEKLGHDRQAIDAFHKQTLDQISRQEEADLKLFAKQAEQVGLKIPSQQIAAQKASADAIQEAAKKRLEREEQYARTASSTSYAPGMTIRDVDPRKGSNETEKQAMAGLTSATLDRELKIIKDNIKEVPATMRKYQQNSTEVEAAENSGSKSVPAAWFTNLTRKVGLTAESPMSGLSANQQRLQQAVDSSNEALSRFWSGAAIQGNLNAGEESRLRRSFSFVPGMTADAIAATVDRINFMSRAIEGLSGPAAAKIALSIADGEVKPGDKLPNSKAQSQPSPSSPPAPMVPSVAAPKTSQAYTPKEIVDLKWARANPGTPQADEIVRAIKAKRGM